MEARMGEGRREVVDLNKTECLVVSVYTVDV